MLANVVTKTIRDRWLAMAVGTGSVALFLLLGMAVYRGIDLSIYTDLPEGVRGLFGYGELTDAGGLALGAVYGFMGALTLGGIAISLGSSAVAGEERNGTLGLLLANPRSRTRVVAAKATSLVLLVTAGALFLWGAGRLVPVVLGVDTAGLHVGALVLHLFAVSLFFGCLALLIGAATGSATAASGASAGVLLVSYVGASVLPLVEGLGNLARALPWYYYESSRPVTNGAHWGHLGVLLGASALFAALAVAGVNRRDLRGRSVALTLLDRLRTLSTTRRITERLAGSTRVSRVAVKTASEHQGLLVITAAVLFGLGVAMGPLYAILESNLATLGEQFPDAVLALVGGADIATPEGWYQTENFAISVPVGLIAVAVVVGAGALAGEERGRTMGLLLANPISRTRVVVEKSLAMVAHAAVLGVVTFVGTAVGSALGGLGMSLAGMAATSALATLLGLVFGATALALSAATGRVRAAAYGAAGLAFASYLAESLLSLDDRLAAYAAASPFHYYLSGDPLGHGMHWGHAAILASLAAGLVGLAVALFRRRDLRLGA